MRSLDLSAIDYIYVVVIILIGIVMVTSPRSFMGNKVKITEESIKAEDLLKKVGIGVIVLALVMGGVIYFR